MRLDRAVLALALLGACLYACMLPLWEGWDEPFHYGYVESLAVFHEIPVYETTVVSREISRSLLLTPLSPYIAAPVKNSTSFAQWHQLPLAAKQRMRARLQQIPISDRDKHGDNPNYESQQTPLAYVLLAAPDLLLKSVQLVLRVVLLRCVQGTVCMLLVFLGFRRLAVCMGLREPFLSAALFCALSVQVLMASLAHVGNDSLAIALTIWLMVFMSEGTQPARTAFILAAGLLTKAYFLAFVPVFYGWLFWRWKKSNQGLWRFATVGIIPVLISGPWYARNLALYKSLSGTQETVKGVTFAKALGAIPHVNWLRSLLVFWRWSLWTGNWSFMAYDKATITAEEVLMAIGVALYLASRRSVREREFWIWSVITFLATALWYQTCVTWVAYGGVATTPQPWYGQGALVAIWTMVFAGLQRYERWGRWCAAALCAVSAVIAIGTYVFKFLPAYGGGVDRGRVAVVFAWWRSNPGAELATVLPAPVAVVYVLLCAYAIALLAITTAIVFRFCRPGLRG